LKITTFVFIGKSCNESMTQQKSLNNYKLNQKRTNMAIAKVTNGIGRTQKGEDKISCTYANADKAVEALLKRL
jgi:hypothetical protein